MPERVMGLANLLHVDRKMLDSVTSVATKLNVVSLVFRFEINEMKPKKRHYFQIYKGNTPGNEIKCFEKIRPYQGMSIKSLVLS